MTILFQFLLIIFVLQLWLALAERYLKRRGVDWEIEKIKWFSDKCRADDEELGIQIVKDLHRTGHSLLAGPSGALNQAKLKKILMGYTRWNPEVGYCQVRCMNIKFKLIWHVNMIFIDF